MEYTAESLEQAVTLFYRSEAAQQANAHQWLTQAQNTKQAWAFIWDLLQPERSTEVQFYAATTLHTKLMKYWHEVPEEQYNELKEKILNSIVRFATGPNIVLNRLCISLAAAVLHMMPHHWPDTINNLVCILQPANFPMLPPHQVAWITMEVLESIPEEYSTIVLTTTRKNVIKNELNANYHHILRLCEHYLAPCSNEGTEEKLATIQKTAKCATAWFRLTQIELDKCQNLVTYLLQRILKCYWQRSDQHGCMSGDEHETSEACLEALQILLSRPETQKYSATVMKYLSMCLQVLSKITAAEFSIENQNEDIVVNIYSLLMAIAETHSRAIIDGLCGDPGESQNICMTLVYEILNCSDRPGIYPVEESCSNVAFGFWYMIQDDILSMDTELQEKCVALVRPVYSKLVRVLVRKATLPSDDDIHWSTEDKEVFRCYRQDVSDTLMYCYQVLTDEMSHILMDILNRSLAEATAENWQNAEACIFAFASIAGNIPPNEPHCVPELLKNLSRIPYAHLNQKLLTTALETIGAYSEWLNDSPDLLELVIPLLCEGLQSNSCAATQSTLALKDITRDCQEHLTVYAPTLLNACEGAIQSGNLKFSENVRLMYSIGKVLGLLPVDRVMEYLNHMLLPTFHELDELVKSPEITYPQRSRIIVKLRMISTLFSSLVMQTENLVPFAANQTPSPVFVVLQSLLPILCSLINKLNKDVHITDAVCFCLKNAVATLLDEVSPILKDLCVLIVNSCRGEPIPSALEVSKLIMICFHRDPVVCYLLREFLNEIISITSSACLPAGATTAIHLSEKSDLIEAFFNFLAQLAKKCIDYLRDPGINHAGLFMLGVHCLLMPEIPAMKAAVSFLNQVLSQGREVPEFHNIIMAHGQELVDKMILCIGGRVPRTQVDPLADLFLVLIKKYSDNLSRWLQDSFSRPNFPTQHCTAEQKQYFSTFLFREKANKRKLVDLIRHFAFVSRGIVCSEYASQLNPYVYM